MELDDLRAALHAQWATAAGAWAEKADYVDAHGAATTGAMLGLSAPRPGERVLELACGPGGLGLAAAQAVAPDGEVVLSDVAAAMTAIAAGRAAAMGLQNVSTRRLDLEDVREPDGSYDVVLCREGLMLVPEPAVAAAEIRRILRPGGRAAIAVWGARGRNPWLGALLDAVSAQLGAPIPPPGIPGPFSLDDPDRLAALLRDAGLSEVAVEEVQATWYGSSLDEWWSTVPPLAGPVAQMLAALPQDAAEAIRGRAQAAVSPTPGPRASRSPA